MKTELPEAHFAWHCSGDGKLIQCSVLFASPGVDDSQVFDNEWAVDGVLRRGKQLSCPLTKLNRLLFPTEASIGQTKRTESLRVIWLVADYFFKLSLSRFEKTAFALDISSHPRSYRLTPC